ncbi:hypothetical protein BBO99_00007892 [Phytophthora kernoviae]|uniref:Uncharacterized protein n=2 Tax=Phytophthora kernoviae TaxID=325452 RepID=A0A3R7G6J0_9STRA|nr:hypothetical protein G195_008990 [Phytophthora kernoviae 00238/432]KAG2514617.1 hypothetical protein JM16_007537 [Phytophthora kernoviae]KAG2518306.1 hypothetical protein JM18_007470 [Phytophthora kernoviae]RLN38379.1 hypothetical protein BBI17_007855 [Phytophthora kernoviae]RLN76010.1 hypothetical protein BBO99_00007892 [Phytophthora kernoviae]
MVQANQFDRDDSNDDDDDTEYVTAVAPPGPLGLNLDGGVLDCAVVMGFAKMRDGSKGPLERHGDIAPGSVLLHGLGEAPLLARYPMDIYAEPLSEGEVASILKVPRPKATVLTNNLRDKCLVRPSRPR